MTPFAKILIANRGEIAILIIWTCHRLDITTLTAYSETDMRAPHARMSDEAVRAHVR